MKKEVFYAKYANTPLGERFKIITFDATSPIEGMTLCDIYQEVKALDDKLRKDEIRRQKIIDSAEHSLTL
mgnify:CR=1 FL=1